ncbi:MAG: ABC transporter permease [Candidatus Alcyoniella australis]|nr:ABC transporter permease [Candidatus Alcyoniella australis]
MKLLTQTFRYRFLLTQLVVKEVKLRYKRSALGIGWSLLNPLLMMGIFTLIFSNFQKIAISLPGHVPYFLYFLSGYIPWIFFSTATANSQLSVVANSSLVKQVHFPRHLLPLATVLANLVHLFLSGLVLICFVAFTPGVGLRLSMLLLPVPLLVELVLVLGLALFVSSMNVSYRDVGQILEVLLQFLFYLTPVFYTLDIFSGQMATVGRVLAYNPLAQLLALYRWMLLGTPWPGWFALWYPAAWGALLLVLGWRHFNARSRTFAKEL